MKLKYYIIIVSLLFGCGQADFKTKQAHFNTTQIDSALQSDAQIDNSIAPYKLELDDKMNEIIGFASDEFNNAAGETGESTLGDFVADLLLEQTRTVYSDTLHMAVINHRGGLRTPIRKGDIKVSNVYELMPFDNEMWVLEISGDLVQQLFNNAAQRKSNCIAGAKYTILNNETATAITINGKAFDPKKIYTVSISDYLAGGGGGHSFLKSITPIFDPDYKCRDMIIDFIKATSKVKGDTLVPKIDGRVKMWQ
ncbi:MAG: 5'-nucleotidase C-terminal domain-containing protein [Bacteroidia bacterium]